MLTRPCRVPDLRSWHRWLCPRPLLRHLLLGTVAMLLYKRLKSRSVGNLSRLHRASPAGSGETTRGRFALQPKVYRIATDLKDDAGFALPHPISFDGVDHVLA